MATFHSGVGGTLTVTGTPDVSFSVLDWSFTTANKLAEVTNSGSAGYEEWLPTVTGASGTANCVWDSTQIPDNGSPGKLEPFRGATNGASDYCTIKLLAGSSTKFYSFSAVIENLTVTSNSQGGESVKFSVAFKSTGTITTPA